MSAEPIQQPPGCTLRHILRDETQVYRIAWSPDGRQIAAPSAKGTIRIWDIGTGETVRVFRASAKSVFCVAWSPDGYTLASGSSDGIISLWNPTNGQLLGGLDGHTNRIMGVEWSPDGKTIASGSVDSTVRLWNPTSKKTLKVLEGHTNQVNKIAWSPNNKMLASASADTTLRIWDVAAGETIHVLTDQSDVLVCVVWSPNDDRVASTSYDCTLKLWNPHTGQLVRMLEGHTTAVWEVAFSPDGRFLASCSQYGDTRLWDAHAGVLLAILNEIDYDPRALVFHPNAPHVLAAPGKNKGEIYIWELDYDTILATGIETAVGYTNARVVLVGDSGVGKSGLGLALTGQDFVPTESTHARHVYTFEDQTVSLPDGRQEQRETLLWDLAGQPGYRIIHQLQLTEVAVALLCFDARSESDPFAGIRYWDRALRQAQKAQGKTALPVQKFLVAARADRGGLAVSQERIEELVQELGFDGYIETSAKEGWGIDDLKAAIMEAIDWEMLPHVSSTDLFVRIKDFLIARKEAGRLLVTVDELYAAFLDSDYAPEDLRDMRAEFETVIGRVESRGLIRRLSFGNLVLLQPEKIDAYASSLVFAARDEPDGLGCIAVGDAEAGNFRMPKEIRLADQETERLLLLATIEDLLRHEIALKGNGDLIFPSQFTRERPDLPDPEGKAVVFTFEGAIQHIYTRLAVRLARSEIFVLDEMWRNAAAFAPARGMCGVWLRELDEGHGEFTLFYEVDTGEETRYHFEQYVEIHLKRWALPNTITRRRVFVCPVCDTPISDKQAQLRRDRNFDWIRCPVCDTRISLRDREERLDMVPDSAVHQIDEAANRGRDRDVAVYTLEGKMATNDFDVFLCHNSEDKPNIRRIAEKLRQEGLNPWLDEERIRPGTPWQRALEEQIENIKSAAVFVGKNGIGPWHRMEIDAFLREFVSRNCPVIPVILPDCENVPDLPVFLRGMKWVDFRTLDPDPLEELIWGITGKRRRP